jgi:hypothetical protein
MGPQPFLDLPAIAALLAGSLLIAISFLTNDGHGALLHFNNLPLDEPVSELVAS